MRVRRNIICTSITISEHGLKEVRKAQVRVEREHLGHSLHAIDEQAAVRRSERAVVRVEAGLRAERSFQSKDLSLCHD